MEHKRVSGVVGGRLKFFDFGPANIVSIWKQTTKINGQIWEWPKLDPFKDMKL